MNNQAIEERGDVSTEQYMDLLLNSEVSDGRIPSPLADLLVKDYPLANMRSADREYFRLLADNIGIYTKELYPPDESWAVGSLGAGLYDDPEYNHKPLDDSQQVRFETTLMDHFARTSRGVSGWQQDMLIQNIQTQRMEEARQESDPGMIQGLFNR
jgi:hypothetical protein